MGKKSGMSLKRHALVARLRELGCVLKRPGNHEVWSMPDGGVVVLTSRLREYGPETLQDLRKNLARHGLTL